MSFKMRAHLIAEFAHIQFQGKEVGVKVRTAYAGIGYGVVQCKSLISDADSCAGLE